jgi:hypothetical protein
MSISTFPFLRRKGNTDTKVLILSIQKLVQNVSVDFFLSQAINNHI